MNPIIYYVLKNGYNFAKFDIGGMFSEAGLIYRDSYHRIAKLKGSYYGKKCFLIGSGPSLTMEDLTAISNNPDFVSIACNSLFKAYEFTNWRADIYCVSDDGVWNTVGDTILAKQQGKPIFVRDTIYDTILPEYQDLVYPVRICNNADYPQRRRFSKNAARYVYRIGSVLYFMLQLAVFLGFDEIYLLGCDCNYSYTKLADGTIQKTGDKDYFLKGYEDRKGHQPINQYDVVIPDYDEARRFCDERNIKVFNATRGGKLESFVRVNFDDIIGGV